VRRTSFEQVDLAVAADFDLNALVVAHFDKGVTAAAAGESAPKGGARC
jgi:hypothetical protein